MSRRSDPQIFRPQKPATKSMAGIRGIIFDLDDTLAPERDYVFSGFRAVASHLALLGVDERESFERMKSIFQADRKRKVFDELLKELGMTSPDKGALLEIYRNHVPDGKYRLYPDCRRNLPLIADKYRCALLTDGRRGGQENKIKALGIGSYFVEIIINENPELFKPHPLPYERIMNALGLTAEHILAIGDNPLKDFITPRRLGMATVRIRRGGIYGRMRGCASWRADWTISSLDELC